MQFAQFDQRRISLCRITMQKGIEEWEHSVSKLSPIYADSITNLRELYNKLPSSINEIKIDDLPTLYPPHTHQTDMPRLSPLPIFKSPLVSWDFSTTDPDLSASAESAYFHPDNFFEEESHDQFFDAMDSMVEHTLSPIQQLSSQPIHSSPHPVNVIDPASPIYTQLRQFSKHIGNIIAEIEGASNTQLPSLVPTGYHSGDTTAAYSEFKQTKYLNLPSDLSRFLLLDILNQPSSPPSTTQPPQSTSSPLTEQPTPGQSGIDINSPMGRSNPLIDTFLLSLFPSRLTSALHIYARFHQRNGNSTSQDSNGAFPTPYVEQDSDAMYLRSPQFHKARQEYTNLLTSLLICSDHPLFTDRLISSHIFHSNNFDFGFFQPYHIFPIVTRAFNTLSTLLPSYTEHLDAEIAPSPNSHFHFKHHHTSSTIHHSNHHQQLQQQHPPVTSRKSPKVHQLSSHIMSTHYTYGLMAMYLKPTRHLALQTQPSIVNSSDSHSDSTSIESRLANSNQLCAESLLNASFTTLKLKALYTKSCEAWYPANLKPFQSDSQQTPTNPNSHSESPPHLATTSRRPQSAQLTLPPATLYCLLSDLFTMTLPRSRPLLQKTLTSILPTHPLVRNPHTLASISSITKNFSPLPAMLPLVAAFNTQAAIRLHNSFISRLQNHRDSHEHAIPNNSGHPMEDSIEHQINPTELVGKLHQYQTQWFPYFTQSMFDQYSSSLNFHSPPSSSLSSTSIRSPNTLNPYKFPPVPHSHPQRIALSNIREFLSILDSRVELANPSKSSLTSPSLQHIKPATTQIRITRDIAHNYSQAKKYRSTILKALSALPLPTLIDLLSPQTIEPTYKIPMSDSIPIRLVEDSEALSSSHSDPTSTSSASTLPNRSTGHIRKYLQRVRESSERMDSSLAKISNHIQTSPNDTQSQHTPSTQFTKLIKRIFESKQQHQRGLGSYSGYLLHDLLKVYEQNSLAGQNDSTLPASKQQGGQSQLPNPSADLGGSILPYTAITNKLSHLSLDITADLSLFQKFNKLGLIHDPHLHSQSIKDLFSSSQPHQEPVRRSRNQSDDLAEIFQDQLMDKVMQELSVSNIHLSSLIPPLDTLPNPEHQHPNQTPKQKQLHHQCQSAAPCTTTLLLSNTADINRAWIHLQPFLDKTKENIAPFSILSAIPHHLLQLSNTLQSHDVFISPRGYSEYNSAMDLFHFHTTALNDVHRHLRISPESQYDPSSPFSLFVYPNVATPLREVTQRLRARQSDAAIANYTTTFDEIDHITTNKALFPASELLGRMHVNQLLPNLASIPTPIIYNSSHSSSPPHLHTQSPIVDFDSNDANITTLKNILHLIDTNNNTTCPISSLSPADQPNHDQQHPSLNTAIFNQIHPVTCIVNFQHQHPIFSTLSQAQSFLGVTLPSSYTTPTLTDYDLYLSHLNAFHSEHNHHQHSHAQSSTPILTLQFSFTPTSLLRTSPRQEIPDQLTLIIDLSQPSIPPDLDFLLTTIFASQSIAKVAAPQLAHNDIGELMKLRQQFGATSKAFSFIENFMSPILLNQHTSLYNDFFLDDNETRQQQNPNSPAHQPRQLSQHQHTSPTPPPPARHLQRARHLVSQLSQYLLEFTTHATGYSSSTQDDRRRQFRINFPPTISQLDSYNAERAKSPHMGLDSPNAPRSMFDMMLSSLFIRDEGISHDSVHQESSLSLDQSHNSAHIPEFEYSAYSHPVPRGLVNNFISAIYRDHSATTFNPSTKTTPNSIHSISSLASESQSNWLQRPLRASQLLHQHQQQAQALSSIHNTIAYGTPTHHTLKLPDQPNHSETPLNFGAAILALRESSRRNLKRKPLQPGNPHTRLSYHGSKPPGSGSGHQKHPKHHSMSDRQMKNSSHFQSPRFSSKPNHRKH